MEITALLGIAVLIMLFSVVNGTEAEENGFGPGLSSAGDGILPRLSILQVWMDQWIHPQDGNINEKNTSLNKPELVIRSAKAKTMLASFDEISSADVLVDISENVTKHIPGSIAIPYTEFLNGTDLKTEPELAKILGKAGISRQDPVIIYGECMPCGGGPAPATFVYWMLKSLGQENVKVLDGSIKDWEASGKVLTNETETKKPGFFESKINLEFTASYDYVKSGLVQIVDARDPNVFAKATIPGAINIPGKNITNGDKINDEAELGKVFASLNKNKSVVAYTDTGVKQQLCGLL